MAKVFMFRLSVVALVALGALAGCKGKEDAAGLDGSVPKDTGITFASCESNTDCKGGEVCRELQCRKACTDGADCAGDVLGVCAQVKGFCVQCLVNDDCPAAQRCEGELCVPGCRTNADCSGGFACRDRSCVSLDPIVCEADEQRCVGNQVHRCGPDGTTEEIVDCAADACRVAGGQAECVARVCEPNSFGCIDSSTAYVCDETGSERQSIACRSEQNCQAGICRNPVCVPGTTSCAGNQSVLCNEDGSSFETVSCATDCVSEFGCSCVDGGCVPRICSPGAGQCVATGVRLCNSNGTGWAAPEACPEVCVEGLCVGSTCEPDATLCSGDLLLTCNSLGTGYVVTRCGDQGEICAEAAGAHDCVPMVCVPDAVGCSSDDSAVVVCNSLGTGEIQIPCGNNETCDRGICVPTVCTPNCSGRSCGADPVCGVSCGTCAGTCTNGQCEIPMNSGLELELTWLPSSEDLDLYFTKDGVGTGELCASTTCSNINCTEDATRPDWDMSGGVSTGDPAMTNHQTSEVIRLVSAGTANYYAAVHAEGSNANSVVATLRVSRNGQLLGTRVRTLAPGALWNGIQLDLSQASPSPTMGALGGDFSGCSGSCVVDTDCPTGQACTPLAIPIPGLGGQCVVGCRSDADCAPQKCGGDNQCHASVVGWGAQCVNNGSCREGLYCGLLSNTCAESCATVGTCGSDPNCCPVSNAAYCRQGFFLSECSDTP